MLAPSILFVSKQAGRAAGSREVELYGGKEIWGWSQTDLIGARVVSDLYLPAFHWKNDLFQREKPLFDHSLGLLI
jgi:hypothetical protein